MARAGMSRWRTRNCAPVADGCDEVQRSLDLLDRVLSEFDDSNSLTEGLVEGVSSPSSQPSSAATSSVATPEDDSPGSGSNGIVGNGIGGGGGGGGHQSEDDGYMSMNGRKAKLQLAAAKLDGVTERSRDVQDNDFPPPPEEAERIISTLLPKVSTHHSSLQNSHKFKGNYSNGAVSSFQANEGNDYDSHSCAGTQTTFPKTKHQRPYGWEKDTNETPISAPPDSSKFGSLPYDKSLRVVPSPWLQFNKVPPRTVPSSSDKHREVNRLFENGEQFASLNTVHESTDDTTFSDDSLEGVPTTPISPIVVNKRGSIAWEVPLDSDETPMILVGAKVSARGRKKSTDYSSCGSLSIVTGDDDWPPRMTSDTDVESVNSLTNVSSQQSISNGGTYVIRKGKNRRQRLPSNEDEEENGKRCSSTFDDIKFKLKEGLVEGLDDSPPDFRPPRPRIQPLPLLHRGVSLPNMLNGAEFKAVQVEEHVKMSEIEDACVGMQSVAVQVSADFSQLNKEIMEEASEVSVKEEMAMSPVQKPKSVAWEIKNKPDMEKHSRLKLNGTESGDEVERDLHAYKNLRNISDYEKKRYSAMERQEREKEKKRWEEQRQWEEIEESTADFAAFYEKSQKSERKDLKLKVGKEGERHALSPVPHHGDCDRNKNIGSGDFRVQVEILQHDFGPLPPSPVEEVEDEYADVLVQPVTSRRIEPESVYRCLDYRRNNATSSVGSIRKGRLPEVPLHQHREPTSSLKTRSVDAGFVRNHKGQFSASHRDVGVERRTLPTDMPGPHHRPFLKRGSHSPRDGDVCASLPETPIFARGCDIPRTPSRDSQMSSLRGSVASRLNGLQSAGFIRNVAGCPSPGSLGEAMAGAELLRMTGPARGWYPRHKQQQGRPVSVEHLDRLSTVQRMGTGISGVASTSAGWGDTTGSRKPLTLPPNLSPKFFQRSPREALRRVTSLLIRKGSKDSKSKDVLSSSVIGPHGDLGEPSKRQKRGGFFRNFWKKSRRYSLDQHPRQPQ